VITRFVALLFFVFTLFCVLAAWIVITTPDASNIKDCLTTHEYKVSLCRKNAQYAPLSQISPHFKNLVIIAEDAAFYGHKGFDWSELKNSLEKNLDSLRFSRGGSTITQQLAKNIYLDFDKSIIRKIREAIIATQIEKILSKDQIFEKYINVIELGPNIFGVKSAAQYYFNKSPADLNILESAFLVYLIPNPKTHAKTFHKGALTPYARYRVLDLTYRLYRFHKISLDQYLACKEIVDAFPWASLDSFQMSRLAGDAESIPPEDSEVLPADEETVTPLQEAEEPEHEPAPMPVPEPEPEVEIEPEPSPAPFDP
jgi:monofunctional biosynthetic peptidoglycan transglycosylase